MHLKKVLSVLLVLLFGLLACPAGKVFSDNSIGGGGGDDEKEESSLPQVEKNKDLSNWGLNKEDSSSHEDVAAEGVDVDDEGNLVLSQQSGESYHMWLADDNNGMISKFDTRTGQELARYYSVIPISCNQGETPRQGCTGEPNVTPGVNYHPGRTAIDIQGNAWVANRGFGRTSSVTKIAGDESFCVDRNNNGHIDTSRVAEDGSISVLEDDECVLFTTPLCDSTSASPSTQEERAGARALAISRGSPGTAGDVWVGCFHDQTAYQLNSTNGWIERSAIELGYGGNTEGSTRLRPYGAIVDGQQNVWMTGRDSRRLQGIDATTGEVIFRNPTTGRAAPIEAECSSYGLAVDAENRVWLSGGCFYNHYASGTEPKWRHCNFDPTGLGIVVDAGTYDADGNIISSNVYITNMNYDASSSSSLYRYSWDHVRNRCTTNPMRGQNSVRIAGMSNVRGVGFDGTGNPWVIGLGSRITRVNLYDQSGNETNSGELLTHAQRATNAEGRGDNPRYYTYSDFTGYQLRNFTAPSGSYKRTFEGCALYSSWKTLSWNATVPEGTTLKVFVRIANTREGLATAPAYEYMTSPADLSEVPMSTFMQLEFILEASADRKSSPIIHGYELAWACEKPLG